MFNKYLLCTIELLLCEHTLIKSSFFKHFLTPIGPKVKMCFGLYYIF